MSAPTPARTRRGGRRRALRRGAGGDRVRRQRSERRPDGDHRRRRRPRRRRPRPRPRLRQPGRVVRAAEPDARAGRHAVGLLHGRRSSSAGGSSPASRPTRCCSATATRSPASSRASTSTSCARCRRRSSATRTGSSTRCSPTRSASRRCSDGRRRHRRRRDDDQLRALGADLASRRSTSTPARRSSCAPTRRSTDIAELDGKKMCAANGLDQHREPEELPEGRSSCRSTTSPTAWCCSSRARSTRSPATTPCSPASSRRTRTRRSSARRSPASPTASASRRPIPSSCGSSTACSHDMRADGTWAADVPHVARTRRGAGARAAGRGVRTGAVTA